MQGMLEAVRGCLKEELRMDVIANNLANASVPGFKKDRVSFQNLLIQQSMGAQQVNAPVNRNSLVHVAPDLSQGDLRFTGNMLDFAINGKGFFKVMTPNGIRYTRKGNFTLDTTGNLITQEGYQVLGKGGTINVMNKQVEVDDRGRVLVDGSELDQLDIVSFGGKTGISGKQQREHC
ncbi:MAG: flagellar hook-basal body complex protein [Deltaproteobacteria bacterium]|nr:flagellar hook-basal body complex protein [Deltaproteobacteria bacterium]